MELKMLWDCCDCNCEGEVEDPSNLDDRCPNCKSIRVSYYSNTNNADFLLWLSLASEQDIVKHAKAIKYCAEDLYKLA